MTELRNTIRGDFREARRIVRACAMDESMSPTERRENIEIAEDHFIDQILRHIKDNYILTEKK